MRIVFTNRSGRWSIVFRSVPLDDECYCQRMNMPMVPNNPWMY